MNELFSRMTRRHTPVMNEEIMRGLAVKDIGKLEQEIDAQVRSICIGLPKSVKYIGCRRCTPMEEYQEVTRDHNNRRSFNLAKSSIYLTKFLFEYTDELGQVHPLFKHIYLIYVEEGGLFHISGTEMHLVPVLSSKVFTPSGESIFVRLVQDRNYFYRMYHTAIIDGKRVSKYVAYGEIYRNSSKNKSNTPCEVTTKAKTTLVHYLFARYGFTEAFRRYANVVPVVGNSKTINEVTYPSSEWVVCSSTGSKPASCIDRSYNKNKIVLAVKRSEWSEAVETLIMGFFYVADHFSYRFSEDINILDDTSLWMILIGHIRFSGNYPEGKLYTMIYEHFETIEPYLDQAAKTKLEECGIYLDNYFDLLWYLQFNFNRLIQENEKNGLSVYGKFFEINHYVLHDILCGFTMMKFNLNKIASKTGGVITKRDIMDNLARTVRMGAIFKLNSGKNVSEVVAYPGDNMYPKITAIVAQQESQSDSHGGEERIVPGPKHYLDLSMLTTGSALNLPKSNPTPSVRVNPWINIDPNTNTVLPSPKFEALIEKHRPKFKF